MADRIDPEGALRFEGIDSIRDYLVNLSDYVSRDTLGQGSFGKVWKGQSRITGWTVAVKELLAATLTGQDLAFFQREVQILVDCDDPFLLEFVGFTNTPPYSILTSFMPCGSLWDALYSKRTTLNGTQKTNIALGMAHGMKYLHSRRIIHRDLKSPNILLDDRMLPKIADFGLSRFINDTASAAQMTGSLGTPIWMAPEIIDNRPYGPPVDVYAYGMILWEMYTGKVPFEGLDRIQVFTQIVTHGKRPDLPDPTCPIAILIQQCWDGDAARRPTFEEIYLRLESHVAYFPDTDLGAVDVLVHEIQQREVITQAAIANAAETLNDVLALRKSGIIGPAVTAGLVQAATDGDVYRLVKLIGAFMEAADINGRDATGVTPLHAAIRSGRALAVQYLLTIKGIDKNAVDGEGLSPLMAAVRYEQPRIVQLLTHDPEVNVNQQNASGWTALHIAGWIAPAVQQRIIAALARHERIRTDLVDAMGRGPLHDAPALVQFFIEKQQERKGQRR